MTELENLLLQAAGRTTEGSGGRKSGQSRPPPPQSRRRRDGSGSDSKSSDDSDDDRNFSSSARKTHPPVPVKKRIDPPPEKDQWSDDDDDEDRPRGGGADDDDSDSAPSIGSDLYKDDEDKEYLGKMSELQREMILADRSTKIDDYRLKKKARETSSKTEVRSSLRRGSSPPPPPIRGRSSLRSDKTTAAKSDALNELRAKRMKQQDPEGYRKMRDGGAAGGKDSTPMKHRLPLPAPDSSESEGESKADDGENKPGDYTRDSSEEYSKAETLKYEDIKAITIRRSKLAKWFMEPFFEELIVGCFVRVGIGKTRSGKSIYRLCMVKNVDSTDPDRHYKLENRTTYKWLNCIWGNESSAARWQMAMVSDSSPLEEEYNDWVREVERSGGRMLGLKEVNEKKEEIQKKINSYVYSAATVKQMLQEKKSASTRPLNIAAEKDRLRKEMAIAESRRDESEMERIQNRFKELEEISRKSKQKDSKAVRLAEMNRKNRAENFKNASEMKPVNTSLKAGEAGYDPFSRRWTRSTNYYVSKAGGENGTEADANGGDTEAAAVVTGDGNAVGSVTGTGTEAGLAATAAALEAAAGAGKLVDTSAPVDQGTESNTLHNFELPITLAGLKKFGGPQGVQAGFMARKQRIEATIGRKVPDNDGRRHALTLTVSDYKRRRGLL
ncbi:protein RTF1-like protein [Iris pallida]|uniref:Protein RTF1-like protein n=1 Tax=Iris pallida TaxID=29817 RepID=A0AAX6E1X6_IRIPA|nr:protein RTF1-like protein [Iris pallida]